MWGDRGQTSKCSHRAYSENNAGRSYLAPGPADRVSGCAVVVHANLFFLSTLENLLPHPLCPVAFVTLEKQVENNLSRCWGKYITDTCTWVSIATLGSSGERRGLQVHSNPWDDSGWTSLIQQLV